MNVICDRALLGAFSRETRAVNADLVRKAAAEVSGQKLIPRVLKWAVSLAAIAASVFLINQFWPSSVQQSRIPQDNTPLAADNEPLAEAIVTNERDDGGGEMLLPEGPKLNDFLATQNPNAGITTLLGIWGIEYELEAGTACVQAELRGLSCYYQRGSWSGIRQLDRPAVITLIVADGANYQAALTGLRDDAAELTIGTNSQWFPIDEVAEMWFGQFMVIWRPPNGVAAAILPGSQNEDVRWLRQSLAALDANYEAQVEQADFFDAGLEQQLILFQRNHRLDPDGLAGQKTQIIINTMLAADGTPRLSESR
jgi:general secretion pathway protein A